MILIYSEQTKVSYIDFIILNLFTKYSFIGGDPEKVKQSVRARFKDDKIVDDVLELDNQWRKRK